MNIAELEKIVLEKLNSGMFDGVVGDIFDKGKVLIIKSIENGIPQIHKHGPSTKFFDNRENIRTPGNLTIKSFEIDEEKLSFLQRFGWLIPDPDVKKYSSYFKPKKKR